MIREIALKDQTEFLKMAKTFYKTNAVLHDIPAKNFESTFKEVTNKSPYAKVFIAEKNGNICGYALLAISYSNEAGGIVVWIEELYIKPEFQGNGIGTELLSFIINKYKNNVARFRLEVEDTNKGAVKLYKKLGFDFLSYKQMLMETSL